ncbi:AraC family ligand binding domain-containing protein, partial [Nocardia wallacei]|uniref:AraC family ligand binding domain-containing protein n=1 Tax=Nocardia wallacei TaxID=480035 RepID=UPI002458DD4C
MSVNRQEMAAPTLARRHPGGSRIERHRHPEHQLVFTSCGAVEVRTDAGCWIAPGDRAIWIPAGCWHEHHFYGPTRFHCVAFTDGLDERTRPSVLTVSPLVRELIIACSTEPDMPAAEAQRLHRVLLDRLRRSPEQPLRLPAARDPRLRRACALVERDLTVGWTLGARGRGGGAAPRPHTPQLPAGLGVALPPWRAPPRRASAPPQRAAK